PVMPTNLYGPGDNYDLLDSHVLPALIRKFHLARLAAAGKQHALAEDAARYGLIPNDFYLNLMRIALAAGHTLDGAGARSPEELPVVDRPAPEVELWGTGTPKREFLYVDDLAEALLFLMSNHSGRDLINIGTGQDLSIRELAEIVCRVVGYRGGMVFDAEKPDGMPRKLLDVSRLRELGWQARTSLEDGIRTAYAAYLEGGKS
ncbi:MAG: NAD-dependent epimerase/dehydratase family protein, partial [Deltaproteobacteria bacterium]|nr:NAD-dependent epimerase/dehydratase family protein [Deltaproteobacteria bacterium]